MTGPHLSAAQARNRMILSARMIAAEHTPRADGRCPICRVVDCAPRADADTYLDQQDPAGRQG